MVAMVMYYTVMVGSEAKPTVCVSAVCFVALFCGTLVPT